MCKGLAVDCSSHTGGCDVNCDGARGVSDPADSSLTGPRSQVCYGGSVVSPRTIKCTGPQACGQFAVSTTGGAGGAGFGPQSVTCSNSGRCSSLTVLAASFPPFHAVKGRYFAFDVGAASAAYGVELSSIASTTFSMTNINRGRSGMARLWTAAPGASGNALVRNMVDGTQVRSPSLSLSLFHLLLPPPPPPPPSSLLSVCPCSLN